MLTTGFDGASSTTSADSIASRTPGAASLLRTDVREAVRGNLARYRTHHSWKWIAFCCSPVGSSGSVMRRGLAAVVADRQQRDTGLPTLAEGFGDGRERVADPQHLAADEVRGDVAIAESEPVGLGAVRSEFLFGIQVSPT